VILTRIRQGFALDRTAAAGAEFALVLPFLALILFGAIEFGLMFRNHNIVAKGVRDAARYLARVPANACSGGTWTSPLGAAVANTQNLATTGVISGGTALVPNFGAGDVAVTRSCIATPAGLAGIYGTGTTVKLAVVTATVTHNFILGGYVIPGVPSLQYVVAHRQPHIGD
jgi:Flp pilus assembly protein TadG